MRKDGSPQCHRNFHTKSKRRKEKRLREETQLERKERGKAKYDCLKTSVALFTTRTWTEKGRGERKDLVALVSKR